MIKTCLIKLDLVLDFNNLVLAIIKEIDPTIDTANTDLQQNPIKHLKNYELLNHYLPTLKPQIGALETIDFLEKAGIQTKIFSDLNLEIFSTIKNHITYLPYLDDYKQLLLQEDSLIIESNINTYLQIQDCAAQSLLMKNHNLKNKLYWEEKAKTLKFINSFEEIKWNYYQIQGLPQFQDPQFKVSLTENRATKHWQNCIKIPSIQFKSVVVHGYNRGGTMLGIPTANMQITDEIHKQIKDLIPGVYVGMSHLKQQGYGSVLSIGYNPYFHNQFKTIEAYLFGEFENDFYGEELEMQITHFVRCESDFRCFGNISNILIDHLIKFINNDKITAKAILNI